MTTTRRARLQRTLVRIIILGTISLVALTVYSSSSSELLLVFSDKSQTDPDLYRLGLCIDSTNTKAAINPIFNVSLWLDELSVGVHKFDWSDWLNLNSLEHFYARKLSDKDFPYLSKLSEGEYPIMPYHTETTPHEQAMIGRLYCQRYLTSPFRIIPLGNPQSSCKKTDKSCHTNVLAASDTLRTQHSPQYAVESMDLDRQHRQYGHSNATEYYEASPPLVSSLKQAKTELSVEDLVFPLIDLDLFFWNPRDVASGRSFDTGALNESSGIPGYAYENHRKTVEAALTDQYSDTKYFNEVSLNSDPAGYGGHYDWRFFRGILPHDEHIVATHNLARAWQQFAEQMGIAYWYAHGSLLGYYWNGLAMPFDNDHDIQVPIRELNRLARDFNRTLVVQNAAEGYRKYLIDVTPAYVSRARGTGQNLIDARFIDVETGAYIDITGLSRTSQNAPMVSCKNGHSYAVTSFTRIQRTSFEGYPALVPTNFRPILYNEYKQFSSPNYRAWRFNENIRMWEPTQTCEEYLLSFADSSRVYCVPSTIKITETCLETYDTCDLHSIRAFEATQDATQLHEREIEIGIGLGNALRIEDWKDHREAAEALLALAGTFFPPLRNSTLFGITTPIVH